MDENARNEIIEIIKSDDVRDFFEEMIFSNNEKKITEANKKMEKLRDENNKLSLVIKELELDRDHYKNLYNDKSNACEKLQYQQQENLEFIEKIKKQNVQLELRMKEDEEKTKKRIEKILSEKDIIKEELQDYENKYQCINKAYEKYLGLNEIIKQRMSNIFIRDDIYSFISTVSDWNSIEGMWTFTKRRIIEEDIEGFDDLIDLFDDSFELYNQIDGNNQYELISPAIGDRFDSDKHSIKGTKTDGQIRDVLLKGIFDNVRGKVLFKAVVQIQ